MNTRHNLYKTNSGGHGVVRATIPAVISRVLTQFYQIVDLSHISTLRRGNHKGENENGGGKGDGGSLILFNRAITQSPICPWIQLSQTT
jgi:hypothetical protein